MSSPEDVFIGLTDPQTPFNVGAVLRAAGCFNAKKVLYSGQRYNNAMKYSGNTQKEGKNIELKWTEDFYTEIEEDMKVICVELIEGATSLPSFVHPEKALYIFGSESGTVLQDVIDKADDCVYVPTNGCMNLAASVNVLLYDRLSKNPSRIEGDALIKSSRMKNNHRKRKVSDI